MPGSLLSDSALREVTIDQAAKETLFRDVDWQARPVHEVITNAWKDHNSIESKYIHTVWQADSEIPVWLRTLWASAKPVPYHLSKDYFDQIDPYWPERRWCGCVCTPVHLQQDYNG